MRKRLSALLVALALLLTCLTGCGSKAADEFYDLADEIAEIQDAEIALSMPYHGAELDITGFVSRTNETADLTFDLSGTDGGDGTWSELRIDGNQLWLNVGQLAERTLCFDLSAYRREDILELQGELTASWVGYTWEGDLWNGIPEWEELLTQLWQDSRSDLERYIQAGDGIYTLALRGDGLETVSKHVIARLTEQSEAYRDSFIEAARRQNGLLLSTQMEAEQLFDLYWESLTGGDEEAEPLRSLTVTLAKDEGGYTVTLSADDAPAARLTLTPAASKTVTAPEEVMPFRAYLDSFYYLVSFSERYVADVLDGVDDDRAIPVEEDRTDVLYPLTTGTVQGYDDLVTVQFATKGGNFSNVPILTGYTGNEVASVNDDGVQVTELIVNTSDWTLQVSSETAEQPIRAQLSDALYRYYDALINVTGYLLVQDISDIVQSADGTAAAQGFSYREHDYAPVLGRVFLLLQQPDGAGYTVLDLEVNLSDLTDADREKIGHLFDYLGLEVPILLQA